MPLTPQRPDVESPPLPSEFYLRAPGTPVDRLVSDSRTPTPSLLELDTLSSDLANSLIAHIRRQLRPDRTRHDVPSSDDALWHLRRLDVSGLLDDSSEAYSDMV
ncbi:hypothetical protein BHM03_00059249 [Ensete ventricosum]|nr:hypothetical protein BHM03_00059249 [Ensete ventricosum]